MAKLVAHHQEFIHNIIVQVQLSLDLVDPQRPEWSEYSTLVLELLRDLLKRSQQVDPKLIAVMRAAALTGAAAADF